MDVPTIRRRGNRFVNPHTTNLRRSLYHFFLWRSGYYDEPEAVNSPPEKFRYPLQLSRFDRASPSAVWMGHCTFLIQMNGLTILTDPVWGEYCSPIPFSRLKRTHAPPMRLKDLPTIDFVLLSHNHYDHLDRKTIEMLHRHHPEIQWIVPIGVKKWFLRRGIDRVSELPWWGVKEYSHLKVTAVPAQHFSGRTLWDKNKTLWNGYVFETKKKRVYFVGDTGYNSVDFKNIGKKFQQMDLSLIPIGTYLPSEFMKPVHANPYEGVQIHSDVNSKLSLGMHWKTFRLSDEPLDLPPYDLYQAMQEKGLAPETFLPIEPGMHVNF